MERRIINPWTWQDQFGFVQANELSGPSKVVLISGQTSLDADGRPLHVGNMEAQALQALDNVETVLKAAGMSWPDVVRLNYYVTDVDAFMASAAAVMGRVATTGCRPASTLLGVSRLAFPELLVEIEATAAV